MMDAIQKKLLEEVADLHDVPQGAYSLRINGNLYGKNDSENITIVAKSDKQGIDIYVKPGTKNESLHIPVLLAQSGLKELVYNDFHIGADCDVTIVAGCGIHNSGSQESEHSGIHAFYLDENARVKYVEKHYGQGEGTGKNVMPLPPRQSCGCASPPSLLRVGAQAAGASSGLGWRGRSKRVGRMSWLIHCILQNLRRGCSLGP